MMKKLKQALAQVFDDNLRTKQWQNWVDYVIIGLIIVSTVEVFLSTFDSVANRYGDWLRAVDLFTTIFFTIEVTLRIWCADIIDPKYKGFWGRVRYCFSFYGLIDILSTYTFYIAFLLPIPYSMLKALRIARLMRVFRYLKAFRILSKAIGNKRRELLVSLEFLGIVTLILSFILYFVEHEVQPEVFQNAFSGFWWAVSTLLTVGYGDIYPVTIPGRLFGILITFLGVGMVAIPTGILSAGFVEQYTKLKSLNDYALATDIRFVRLPVREGHPWRNLPVKDLPLPPGLILAIIQRKNEVIVPRGDTVVEAGDQLVLGAEAFQDEAGITLKELTLTDRHPWAGLQIKDLDISRQTVIVMVRRNGRVVIPNGSLQLLPGDIILLYTKRIMRNTQSVQI